MLTLVFLLATTIAAALTAATAMSPRDSGSSLVATVMPIVSLVVAAVLWTQWKGNWRLVPFVLVVVAAVAIARTLSAGGRTAVGN